MLVGDLMKAALQRKNTIAEVTFLQKCSDNKYFHFKNLTVVKLGKNLFLDLQRKLYIIKVRWQVKKGR